MLLQNASRNRLGLISGPLKLYFDVCDLGLEELGCNLKAGISTSRRRKGDCDAVAGEMSLTIQQSQTI